MTDLDESTTATSYGVITETEDSISFRLPLWLTDEERARVLGRFTSTTATVVTAWLR